MTIQWNKVTWYSKVAAAILFVATFAIAFHLGIAWEQVQVENALIPTPAGAAGGNSGAPVAGAGQHCGGFIKDAPVCGEGYHCQLKVSMPDTGGTCVKE